MVFQRREKKYLLSLEQREELLRRIAPFVELDPYGEYTVSNLYFDTPNFDVIQRSLEHPHYKEKLRIRSYVVPKSGDPVYFEIKKKLKGVGYKRRTPIEYSDAKNFLNGESELCGSGQIFDEVMYLLKRTKVYPRVMICYERLAFHDKTDNTLRITFDNNIRYRTDRLDPALGTDGNLLNIGDYHLVEIKSNSGYPLWLSSILSDLKIYPSSFSKYGRVYVNHLLKGEY